MKIEKNLEVQNLKEKKGKKKKDQISINLDLWAKKM